MQLPRRVMLIGLDALDHRWLARHLADGRLPNLAHLASNSFRLDISSDGELLHGSIWPTFAAGQGPGHHGIYWWTQWLAEEARYVRNSHPALHSDPFWRNAALAGRRSIVIDVPYVQPVRDGHTWTAVGWGLHDEMAPASYPARFLPSIRRRYGDHPLRMDTMHSMEPAAKRKMAKAMAKGVAMRARLISDFAARRDWDLFVATFSETHKAGHYLAMPQQLGGGMTNDHALVSILEPFDAALPGILRNAGEDCDVAVFALHGMSPQVEWSAVAPQFAALVDDRDIRAAAPPPDLLRRARDLLPPGWQQAIWYLFPPQLRQRRFAQSVTRGLEGNERLFRVAHDGALALRLNLEGRERDGVVTTAEAETLIRRAAELARNARTEHNEPAFEEIVLSRERFPGPRSHRLPDAFVPLSSTIERVAAIEVPGEGEIQNPSGEARNGVHTGRGFCFYRPGAPADLLRESVDSLDFAPTILSRIGVTVPPDFEGTPFLA